MQRHHDLAQRNSAEPPKRSVCIATIAVGAEYRTLAKRLVRDVEEFCPGVPVLVLTDDLSIAESGKYVKAIPFRHPGFWYLYYAKIEAFRAALRDHDVCIFLDADCRLLASPPVEAMVELAPGAYGAYTQPFPFKIAGDHTRFLKRGGRERWLRNSPKRQEYVYRRLGDQLQIDVEQCTFLHESCLVLVKAPATPLLLDVWQFLGRAASCRLLEWGEGYTLGMALQRLSSSVGAVPDIHQWLFKDLLMDRRDAENPRVAEFLKERRAVASPGMPDRRQKVLRLIGGLLRYLRVAPVWLAAGERRERKRILQLMG